MVFCCENVVKMCTYDSFRIQLFWLVWEGGGGGDLALVLTVSLGQKMTELLYIKDVFEKNHGREGTD